MSDHRAIGANHRPHRLAVAGVQIGFIVASIAELAVPRQGLFGAWAHFDAFAGCSALLIASSVVRACQAPDRQLGQQLGWVAEAFLQCSAAPAGHGCSDLGSGLCMKLAWSLVVCSLRALGAWRLPPDCAQAVHRRLSLHPQLGAYAQG